MTVDCSGSNGRSRPFGGGYEDTSEASFAQLLSNSTFAFAPGGGGPHSYRFMEAISHGAIPVVTTDLVLPFEPDLDWSGCVVRISEGALVTMPRVLREIEPEELAVRRDECARLFRVIMEPDALCLDRRRHQHGHR